MCFGILGLQSTFNNNKPSHYNTVLVPFSTHHIQTNNHIVFYYPFLLLELINVDKSTHHQVSLLSNIYHKEIHVFHTLSKSLEIYLPPIVEQSLSRLESPPFIGLPNKCNLFKYKITIRF